jgi:hypothetical protein
MEQLTTKDERQLVMLLAYFINKYASGYAIITYDDFIKFMDLMPILEKKDDDKTSYYKVIFEGKDE